MKEQLVWQENLGAHEWDTLLAKMHGHPLQSALWGDARCASDGTQDTRWAALINRQPVLLIRFEQRRILKLLKVAWVPQGPLFIKEQFQSLLKKQLLQRLRVRGYFLCVMNPWQEITPHQPKKSHQHTIFIDLTVGKDQLWVNLHKQFRYDVRNAERKGVLVEQSTNNADIVAFYELCKLTSVTKGFRLGTSIKFITALLRADSNAAISAHFFVARYAGQLCGGAVIIRCGSSVHYMWGAIDRQHSKLSIGEALQWAVVEWALKQQCTLYDLEGVNPKIRCGTYYFKKKLGGREVVLPGLEWHSVNWMAHVAVAGLAIKNKLMREY